MSRHFRIHKHQGSHLLLCWRPCIYSSLVSFFLREVLDNSRGVCYLGRSSLFSVVEAAAVAPVSGDFNEWSLFHRKQQQRISLMHKGEFIWRWFIHCSYYEMLLLLFWPDGEAPSVGLRMLNGCDGGKASGENVEGRKCCLQLIQRVFGMQLTFPIRRNHPSLAAQSMQSRVETVI